MTIIDQFLRDGDRLFRWRSYFPLVLVPVVLTGVADSPVVFATVAAERAWEMVAVAVALAGLVLRIVAVGSAPSGTSERSTVAPRASELRTSGVYSVLRHPLYLANGLMALGIALFPGVWYLPLIVLAGTTLYYERIAAREEQFLEGLFGEHFQAWCRQVPAVVPRMAGWRPSATPFSWRKVVRSEVYGLVTITASMFVVDVAQAWMRTRTWSPDALWAGTFLVTGVLMLTVRTLKKTTRLFS